MDTEKHLIEETKKWLAKAKAERKKIHGDIDYIKNIDAYISDSEHFLARGDFVRAFEAVIWSWAWIDILEQMKMIEKK